MPENSPISVAREAKSAPRRQRKMDLFVGYLLLSGVLLSMALIVGGMIWRFIRIGQISLSQQIAGMNLFEFVVSEGRIVIADQLRPRTLIACGIAVLMLTPYMRVLASVLYFAFRLKNWKYSLFTAIVLGVLTFSLFIR
ncbi:MAG TPA: DUF1634 domain-containing protein [Verrucomicrobiae bacterium]|nr:DUF1634 domain-containing protein [Verrucomicrobiae bacterium]